LKALNNFISHILGYGKSPDPPIPVMPISSIGPDARQPKIFPSCADAKSSLKRLASERHIRVPNLVEDTYLRHMTETSSQTHVGVNIGLYYNKMETT
jgi:hypothetical protein